MLYYGQKLPSCAILLNKCHIAFTKKKKREKNEIGLKMREKTKK